jgi:hypothetical protein
MNRVVVYLFLSFGLSFSVFSQAVRMVRSLPAELKENSGMVNYGSGLLYFINDGGNAPLLHRYDTFNNQYSQVEITNALNVDWEDLAQDDEGSLYIGDFGNNNNTRTNLKIYKTINPEVVFSNEITADSILFTYGNQTDFPPSSDRLNFDCEAMIWYQDSIYLFSKNRTSPYDGWCYMYVLSDKMGVQTARLADSVLLAAGTKEFDWITAADIRNDTLVLLSSNKVYLFNGFLTNNLSSLEKKSYRIDFSQKEAVSFGKSANELFVSDEFNVFGNNLYLVTLEELSTINDRGDLELDIIQTSQFFSVKTRKNTIGEVRIYTALGCQVYSEEFNNQFSTAGSVDSRGSYVVKLFVEGKTYNFKWQKSE